MPIDWESVPGWGEKTQPMTTEQRIQMAKERFGPYAMESRRSGKPLEMIKKEWSDYLAGILGFAG